MTFVKELVTMIPPRFVRRIPVSGRAISTLRVGRTSTVCVLHVSVTCGFISCQRLRSLSNNNEHKAGIVLFIVVYLFGVIFLNGAADYIRETNRTNPYVDILRVFFESLPKTMLTLFMSITGGLSWWEVQLMLVDFSIFYAFLFIVFILVSVLATLNIITGIFVNDAIEMARMDTDIQVQQEMEDNRHYLQKLDQLFKEIDANNTGSISQEDFIETMEREDVRLLFTNLGLDVVDAVSFFNLLDVDGSVELEIDEFVMGCMRFRGNPTSVNLECSVLEAKQLLVKSMTRQKKTNDKVVTIAELLRSVCEALQIGGSISPKSQRLPRKRLSREELSRESEVSQLRIKQDVVSLPQRSRSL